MKPSDQLPVAEAIRRVRARAALTTSERVSLDDAYGRVLAEDLASLADHPSVDNSALDGYACREADTRGASAEHPVRLALVGEVAAGVATAAEVAAGQAVRIFTGAGMPPGADAIVPVEVTSEEDGVVLVGRPARREDVRPRAQDLERGSVYLRAGERLGAAAVALAAAMGHATVAVRRRPVVGVLATGDEVIAPGRTLAPGQVYDANSYSVAGLIRAAGGEPRRLGMVADDVATLERALGEAGALDLLLTSGGVSMGRYDFVRDLLFERGEVDFWKVAMRPGGPALFGSWHDLPVLGLPGNPVSSMVVFLVLGRAFVDTALGSSAPLPYHRRRGALAGERFAASGFKETFSRVALDERDGATVARSTGNQSSGVLRSMVDADALAVLPPHAEVEAGERLEVIELAPHLG